QTSPKQHQDHTKHPITSSSNLGPYSICASVGVWHTGRIRSTRGHMAQTATITAPIKQKHTGRIFYTTDDDTIDLPNLVDHQNTSFLWFVQEGLGELLAEVSPIDDYTG